MEKLRSPEGCPWDKEQTHQSIKRYLLEEAYEAYEAISEKKWKKLKEELNEWEEARKSKNKQSMEEELGDLLFMITNLARWLELNAEEALLKANRKFRKRFSYIEKISKKRKQQINQFSSRELEKL